MNKKLNEEQLVQEMTPEQAAQPVAATPADVENAQAAAPAPTAEAPAPAPEEAPAVEPAPVEEPAIEEPIAEEMPEVAPQPTDELPAGTFKAPVEGMVPSGWIFPEEMAAAVAMQTGDVEAAGTAPDAVVQPKTEPAPAPEAEGELQLESVQESVENMDDKLDAIILQMRAADKEGNQEEVEKCKQAMIKLLGQSLKEECLGKDCEEIIDTEALEPGEAHPEDRDDLEDVLTEFGYNESVEDKPEEAEELPAVEEKPAEEPESEIAEAGKEEEEAGEVCPECGKNPCECKGEECDCAEGEECVCEDGECTCKPVAEEIVDAVEELKDEVAEAEDPADVLEAAADFLRNLFNDEEEEEVPAEEPAEEGIPTIDELEAPAEEEVEEEEDEEEFDFSKYFNFADDEVEEEEVEEEEAEIEEDLPEDEELEESVENVEKVIFYPAGSKAEVEEDVVKEATKVSEARQKAFNKFQENLDRQKVEESKKLYRKLLNEKMKVEQEEDDEDKGVSIFESQQFSWKEYLAKYNN